MSTRRAGQLVRNSLIAFSVLLFLRAGEFESLGWQTAKNEGQPQKIGAIAVGISIEDAKAVLSTAKITAAGPRSFAAHPAGDNWLFYTIREGKIDLVVQYAPGSGRVTDLTIYYIGYPRSRMSDIAVAAKVIQFNSDGSYWVLFPPVESRK